MKTTTKQTTQETQRALYGRWCDREMQEIVTNAENKNTLAEDSLPKSVWCFDLFETLLEGITKKWAYFQFPFASF